MIPQFVCPGCLNYSPVHTREAYKSALLASATSVIFVHSHPSGDPEPSESDREITKQLKNVIIGKGKYYSFMDKGEL